MIYGILTKIINKIIRKMKYNNMICWSEQRTVYALQPPHQRPDAPSSSVAYLPKHKSQYLMTSKVRKMNGAVCCVSCAVLNGTQPDVQLRIFQNFCLMCCRCNSISIEFRWKGHTSFQYLSTQQRVI